MYFPKISVVTIVLNREKFIRAAIECVLMQKYANFEHIVIDGGSTDRTMEIVREYPHIRWISEKDGGSVFALNKGLKMVTGDVWGWLNSDESYLPGAFFLVAKYFEDHPDWDLIYGASDFVDENGLRLGRRRSQRFSYRKMVAGFNLISAPSAMFMRRRALDGIGRQVDVQWKHSYDLDLWLRVARSYKVHNIPECISTFGLHADSGVAGSPHHALKELAILRRHHGGEKGLLNRIFWVPYFKLFLFLYTRLKWNRMVRRMHTSKSKFPVLASPREK